MSAKGFTLFDTPVGRCGIAWSDRGIAALQLPERRDSETRASLLARCPDAVEAAPPGLAQRAIDAVTALLAGQENDLAALPLDMGDAPPFHRRVYEMARQIAPGETLSYGAVAERIGAAGAARAVGQAVRRNPFAIIVPCHRILAAGGKIGGYSANGGITTKLRLLTLERPLANGGNGHFEGDGVFGFDPNFAIAYLRDSDPAIARVIAEIGPFRMQLKKTPSLFLALAEAIVYQQLHGKAAATIFARLCALFPHGPEGMTPKQILRASDEKLRGAGLSRSKLLALRDLAQKAADGTIPTLADVHKLDNDAIIERLTSVRGIGRWTVEMLLIFRLGRPDVLPVDDLGVLKGFAYATKKRALPKRHALGKYGERWKPYRSVASWYLWRAAERAVRREKDSV